jgi:hypothetical protein
MARGCVWPNSRRPREAGEGLDEFYWVLKVIGKGNKPRVVPLPDRVAEELAAYLRSRGIRDDLRDCDGSLPLIERLRNDAYELPASGKAKTTLAPSSIYRSLKQFFRNCAAALEGEGNDVAAERLRAASTHWLRHIRMARSGCGRVFDSRRYATVWGTPALRRPGFTSTTICWNASGKWRNYLWRGRAMGKVGDECHYATLPTRCSSGVAPHRFQ